MTQVLLLSRPKFLACLLLLCLLGQGLTTAFSPCTADGVGVLDLERPNNCKGAAIHQDLCQSCLCAPASCVYVLPYKCNRTEYRGYIGPGLERIAKTACALLPSIA